MIHLVAQTEPQQYWPGANSGLCMYRTFVTDGVNNHLHPDCFAVQASLRYNEPSVPSESLCNFARFTAANNLALERLRFRLWMADQASVSGVKPEAIHLKLNTTAATSFFFYCAPDVVAWY